MWVWKGFSTQYNLFSLMESWNKALDNKGFGGKAFLFDTLNYALLIAELSVHDFTNKPLNKSH